MSRAACVFVAALCLSVAASATPAPASPPVVSYACQAACVAGTSVDIAGSGFDPRKGLRYTITGPGVAPYSSLLYGQPFADGTMGFTIGGPFLPNPGVYTVTFYATQGSKTAQVASVSFEMVAT